jgi:dihydroneopterin aldolase
MVERPLITVGGLIIAPDGDILLVRSKKWSDLYSLPGGKVEWGETREEAFRREVWEETRLKLASVYFTIVQDCIFSPEFWQKRHFIMNDFIADLHPDCHKNQVILNDEAYEFIWINPKVADSLPLHRECRLLIHWYLDHFKNHSQKILGTIGLYHHRIRCLIGINPEERVREQEIYVDVKVQADFSACVKSDCIQDTCNYVKMAEICTQLAQEKKYKLLETFANDVLDQLLKEFNVESAWICVKKPSAIATADYTSVELEKHKERSIEKWLGH